MPIQKSKEHPLSHLTDPSAEDDTQSAPAGVPTQTSDDLLALIEHIIAKEKGEDIITISLAGKTSIADFMVVASGRSTRQVSSMSENLVEQIKTEGFGVPKVEGKEAADWVLIDTGDVIVHLFRPEVREFYQIEKIWQGESGEKPEAAEAAK